MINLYTKYIKLIFLFIYKRHCIDLIFSGANYLKISCTLYLFGVSKLTLIVIFTGYYQENKGYYMIQGRTRSSTPQCSFQPSPADGGRPTPPCSTRRRGMYVAPLPSHRAYWPPEPPEI